MALKFVFFTASFHNMELAVTGRNSLLYGIETGNYRRGHLAETTNVLLFTEGNFILDIDSQQRVY